MIAGVLPGDLQLDRAVSVREPHWQHCDAVCEPVQPEVQPEHLEVVGRRLDRDTPARTEDAQRRHDRRTDVRAHVQDGHSGDPPAGFSEKVDGIAHRLQVCAVDERMAADLAVVGPYGESHLFDAVHDHDRGEPLEQVEHRTPQGRRVTFADLSGEPLQRLCRVVLTLAEPFIHPRLLPLPNRARCGGAREREHGHHDRVAGEPSDRGERPRGNNNPGDRGDGQKPSPDPVVRHVSDEPIDPERPVLHDRDRYGERNAKAGRGPGRDEPARGAGQPQPAIAVLRQAGAHFPAISDSTGALFQAFQGATMPLTVFIDRSGRIDAVEEGTLSTGRIVELATKYFGPNVKA